MKFNCVELLGGPYDGQYVTVLTTLRDVRVMMANRVPLMVKASYTPGDAPACRVGVYRVGVDMCNGHDADMNFAMWVGEEDGP